VRKPVGRPVSRPKKELPESNPLRTTPPALSRRNCRSTNDLASSSPFRSPENRKEPPTELGLRSLQPGRRLEDLRAILASARGYGSDQGMAAGAPVYTVAARRDRNFDPC
jgi:hypothetical protein